VIAQVNQTLEKHEQIKCILITDEEWNVDNGLLTPTLKVRRQSADERYLPVIATGASGKMGEHKLIRL
jgi:long-chain acyl-CoA synthetase